MIKRDDLEDFITSSNLVCFEASMSSKNLIFLKNKEISELIRFAETNKIRTILYNYDYYKEDDYLIDEEMLLDYDNRIIETIKEKVSDYNNRNSKLDFARPMNLAVYCLYEGFSFVILYEDYWIEEMNILEADDKLDELVDSCHEILEKISIAAKNEKKELLSSLKEFILTDTNFFFCTNQDLRRKYIYELLDDRKEYKKAFTGSTGNSGYYNYIEFLWKEYKSKK